MKRSRITVSSAKKRAGFSLVEVALALMVAASGLVAIFSLFPASLKQGSESRADLSGALFASTLLETIAGNVRQIDDIKVWNDPEKWWDVALSDTGLSGSIVKPANMSSKFSGPTSLVAVDHEASAAQCIFYVGKENTSIPNPPSDSKIAAPAQWLVRVAAVERKAIGTGGRGSRLSNTSIPNRYVVSVVSSPNAAPEIFTTAQTYSQEYSFVHRP